MSIRSRVESLRRRLDSGTAPGPREFQSALRMVTRAALGQGPTPTAADVDSRIGAIDSSPVRRDVLREAYECFAEFGELPDDDHVAFEVVQQALRGGEEGPLKDDAVVAVQVRKARLAYHQRERPGDA